MDKADIHDMKDTSLCTGKLDKIKEILGGGGACPSFQHSGSRGRWVSESDVSLVYTVNFRTAGDTW